MIITCTWSRKWSTQAMSFRPNPFHANYFLNVYNMSSMYLNKIMFKPNQQHAHLPDPHLSRYELLQLVCVHPGTYLICGNLYRSRNSLVLIERRSCCIELSRREGRTSVVRDRSISNKFLNQIEFKFSKLVQTRGNIEQLSRMSKELV